MGRVADDGATAPLNQGVPSKSMTGKCKLCLGCAIFWVLFLAVMIPVSLKVIAPKIGQMAIDMTSFHIKNYTIYGSPGDSDNNFSFNGWVHNTMNLHSPIFIGAIVHDVNVTMVINQPSAENQSFVDTFGFSNGPIGWFTQPKTTVTQGDNWVDMDVPVHFNSTADNGYRFPSWAFYVWMSGVVYIDLVAEPKLTALGFVTMKTKMKKQIACNCVPGTAACAFPKEKPSEAYTPIATYREDDSYFEPLPDNKTRDPEPYNVTHDQRQDFYYLPIMTLSCEPLGTPVYNGTDIMPAVSTTMEFGFAV